MILASLDPRRFDALASYARSPDVALLNEEVAAYATPDEKVLGLVLADLGDGSFSIVVFGKDEVLRYRDVKVGIDYPSFQVALDSLFNEMRLAHRRPHFHRGDATAAPVDFFTPQVEEARQHRHFRLLCTEPKYSPAKAIIASMMRYHEDVDGRWVQNFQAAGFDARLWELYLWAAFTELGFVRDGDAQVPDLILRGLRGRLSVEAATVNPPDQGEAPNPKNQDEARAYLENYVPIRLAQTLKGKLKRKPPYWEEPGAVDQPFCIAVQDFSAHGAMRLITQAATEYVFGVRHSIVENKHKIEPIRSHRYGKKIVRPGFFNEPGAENVSAVIINPQGTLSKFNRLGFAAGFGSRDVRMVRTGLERREGKPGGPVPRPFRHVVDENYVESWVEGMVVLHNPKAKTPLDPSLLPTAAHELLQPDGSILSILPDFHPYTSESWISVGATDAPDAAPME